MRLLRVEVENYCGIRRAVLELDGLLTAVLGRSGAGKSALCVSAWLYALTCKARSSRGPEGDVYFGASRMSVAVEFEIDGSCYRVVRGQVVGPTSRGTLDVQRWSAETGAYAPVAARRAEMEEFLDGLGFRRPRQDEVGLLEATVFSVQGDAAVFAAASPSQRKALVMGLIPELERYRSLEKLARARLGEAERQLDLDESELRRAKAELEGLAGVEEAFRGVRLRLARCGVRVRLIERRCAAAQDELGRADRAVAGDQRRAAEEDVLRSGRARDAAERELAELEIRVADCREGLERLDALRSAAAEVPVLKASIVALDTARVSDNALQLQAEQSRGGLARASGRRDVGRRELQGIATRARLLRQVDTETICRQPEKCPFLEDAFQARGKLGTMAAAYAQAHREVRRAEGQLDALRREWRARRDHYSNAEHERLATRLSGCEEAAKAASALERDSEHLAGWERQVEAARQRLDAAEGALRTAMACSQSLAAQGGSAAEARRRLERLLNRKDQGQRLRDGLVADRGRLQERRARRASLLVEEGRLGQRVGELTRGVAALRLLVTAYGRDGIPAFVVESDVLPALEAAANAVLGHLPGGFAVQFRTQRATKTTSELKETLDILINGRQFETFSCGEQYRIAFALRVAMAELAARRSGLRLETLVIDEGFGSQDSEGRQALVEAVASLARAGCFARIIVITHISEVVDQLEAATGGALRRVVLEGGEVVDQRDGPGIEVEAAD